MSNQNSPFAGGGVAQKGLERTALNARLWVLALYACAVIGLSTFATTFTSAHSTVAAFWPTNTLALAMMMRWSRSRRDDVLVLGLLAGLSSLSARIDGRIEGLGDLFSVIDVAQVSFASVLARRFATSKYFTVGQGWRFLLAAGPAPILTGSALAAAAAWGFGVKDWLHDGIVWLLAEFLSLVLLGPFLMTVSADGIARLRLGARWPEAAALFAVIATATLVAFSHSGIHLLFVVMPFALVAAFRFGVIGANIAVLLIACIGAVMTSRGLSPLAGARTSFAGADTLILQLFLATQSLTAIPVASAVDQRNYLVRMAQKRTVELSSLNASLVEAKIAADLAETIADTGHWTHEFPTERHVWSAGTFRIFGLPQTDEPPSIEETISYFKAEDRDRIRGLLETCQNEKRGFAFESELTRPDGSTCLVRVKAEFLAMENGRSALFGVMRDITEQKALEAELRTAKVMAERAADAKTAFLANMSHEIRTPLNCVIGFSSLIVEAPELSDPTRERAHLVKEASYALLSVVNDILDYSKIEAEGVVLSPEPVILPDLLADALKIMEEGLHRKGLDFELKVEGLERALLLDPVRVRQVVFNLMGNAQKFTDKGSITLEAQERPEGFIEVSISDTGVGIPKERLTQIFDRFEQADNSIARRFGGTGLGLPICKAIINAMDGEMGVESTPGVGSRFWFRIPLVLAAAEQQAERSSATDLALLSDLRMLYADDNASNRALLKAVLESAGAQVECVENGALAIERCAQTRFDLIFLDVHMPVMDGLEAARGLRAMGITTPIVAVTADVLPDSLDLCRDAGMSDFLAKPYTPIDLLRLAASSPDMDSGQKKAAPKRRRSS